MHHRIEFKQRFWKNLNRRGRKAKTITKDKIPTKEQLAEILSNGRIQEKAFFMVLATSGMRIGEATQLKLEDIDFSNRPTKINVRAEYTKTNEERFTFITEESSRYVKEWLKQRELYLQYALKTAEKLNKPKSEEDGRVFPFEAQTARKWWKRLLKKVDLDERDKQTGFLVYRPHTLRKFFRSNFVKAATERPTDYAEALLGHRGYVTHPRHKCRGFPSREENI
ncbi:MAG: tyrosine-type recombinase/integrase [Candidatus Thermoplasmatota archaeon]